MQRELRSARGPRASWSIALAAALVPAVFAQSPAADPPPPAQDTEPRAAVLHALFVLRIAPYLTREAANEPRANVDSRKPKEKDPAPVPKTEDPAKEKGKDGPAEKPRPYRIGLVGKDDITSVAPRHITDKKVGSRPTVTVVVPLDQATKGTNKDDYDLLYVAAPIEPAALQQILASHAATPVPIVSTRPGFVADGGGIQLFVQDNLVRFEVNAEVLKRQGVHVDSQLQKLSKRGPR